MAGFQIKIQNNAAGVCHSEFSMRFTPRDGPLGRSNVIGLIGTFVLKLNGPGHEIIIYFIIWTSYLIVNRSRLTLQLAAKRYERVCGRCDIRMSMPAHYCFDTLMFYEHFVVPSSAWCGGVALWDENNRRMKVLHVSFRILRNSEHIHRIPHDQKCKTVLTFFSNGDATNLETIIAILFDLQKKNV